MDSDSEDMFQPTQTQTQLTSKSQKKKLVKRLPIPKSCDRVVLFNWKHGNNSAFQFYKKDLFSGSEIHVDWLKYQLVPKSRLRKMKPVESMPGKVFSMFAKIDSGKYFFRN